MCGKTRKDEIRNVRVQEHLGLASIGDRLRHSLEMVWTSNAGQQRTGDEKFFYEG